MSETQRALNIEQYKSELDAPFVYQSTASVDNIPSQVLPVVDEIKHALESVYGPELNAAFYLDGSVVGGGFRIGDSDIDGVWIVDRELADDHRDRRQEVLSKIDLRGVVKYLDIIAMPAHEVSNPGRRSTNFVCYFNGVKYCGGIEVDFSKYIPRTKGDYLACQFGSFRKIIESLKSEKSDELSAKNIAKRLARAWYVLGYLKGAPYQQHLTRMSDTLRGYGLVEELEGHQEMMNLFGKDKISNEEVDRIYAVSEMLVPLIESIINVYESDYTAWTRSSQ